MAGEVSKALQFVTNLDVHPDALQALTLLFEDDVKMVTPRAHNTNLHSFLTATWDWSQKWDIPINPAKCKYLSI